MIALPDRVSFTKRVIGQGRWSYDFQHVRLGALGRVVLTELPDNTHAPISYGVAEHPDAMLTAERRRTFEPIGLEIAERMEQAFAHHSSTAAG